MWIIEIMIHQNQRKFNLEKKEELKNKSELFVRFLAWWLQIFPWNYQILSSNCWVFHIKNVDVAEKTRRNSKRKMENGRNERKYLCSLFCSGLGFDDISFVCSMRIVCYKCYKRVTQWPSDFALSWPLVIWNWKRMIVQHTHTSFQIDFN